MSYRSSYIHLTFNSVGEIKMLYKLFNKLNHHRIKKDIQADVEYDGLRFTTIEDKKVNISNLIDGDFLFCRPHTGSDIQKQAIQFSTGGYYTHCAIYVGNGEIIDAVRPTVRKIELSELLKNYRYVVVVRIFGNKEYPDRQLKIVDYAKNNINKKYNLNGAIISPIKEEKNVIKTHTKHQCNSLTYKKRSQNDDSLFCSQLLIGALCASGYIGDAQDEKYFQSENWTPNGLAKYGYGRLFELVGYLGNDVDKDDYFISGNMGNCNEY